MKKVLTAKQSREFDRYIIEDLHVPGLLLMENAARAVTEAARDRGDVLILCGTGNNGGDGFAVLRQLTMLGSFASACLIGDESKLRGDARINYDAAIGSGCEVYSINSVDELDNIVKNGKYSVLIDALFGTGLDRDITGLYADVINYANDFCGYHIAVDIPSGISADSGKVLGTAFTANATVTFQTYKRGHLLFPGRSHCGEVSVSPIFPTEPKSTEYFPENIDLIDMKLLRRADSHKNTYGKVLVIGGCEKYAGAAVMSAVAAQRIGAGLVKAICSPASRTALLHHAPEVMSCVTDSFDENITELDEHIEWVSVTACGMGAGKSDGMPKLLEKLIQSGKPLIIDADGLNCIAENRYLLAMLHDKCILTPHVGEFARLIQKTTAEINENFTEYAVEFAKKYGVVLLLKSATSVTVSAAGEVYYNTTGNSGLAKGGSGDTLSGLIAGIAAQGINPVQAAYMAARFQGLAAQYADLPEQVMSATDIANTFSKVLDELQL